jgi:hypothetical protein
MDGTRNNDHFESFPASSYRWQTFPICSGATLSGCIERTQKYLESELKSYVVIHQGKIVHRSGGKD